MFRAFIFSSVYVSFCAVLMIWQVNILSNIIDVNNVFYIFVFFATICSYNFHWYLTPADYSASERILWGARHKTLQLTLCTFGGIGAVLSFWFLRAHWLPLAGAAILTFLYSAPKLPHPPFIWLRKIAIGKTLFLSFVWTYVTTLLPVFIAGKPVTLALTGFTLHRFFLIYAICILFDYRDLEADKREGIRSLITYLSRPNLKRLYYFSLLFSAVFALTLLPLYHWPVTVFLLAPVLTTALLTRYTMHTRSDLFYYFVLDGMVMLSALLHILLVKSCLLIPYFCTIINNNSNV
ncbi:UbiA prenyltransferase family protein [Chitinophaga sp. CF118]|uniref:UbiA family prenyltransferase n=1 Tax=Chitinophaga sp. CF118 TaxID=1884367 RepID=UPI0008EA2674|nr:UbiA family prenyltransferase [Chitinophaga sp. CF118]SFE03604.1 UbiA prenyltransferase family protein [Chitinophaga sp. CF118]